MNKTSKKVFSVITALLLTISGFAQTTIGGSNISNTNCVEFSMDGYDAVLAEGGTHANAYAGMVALYDFCVSHGGYAGDSIVNID